MRKVGAKSRRESRIWRSSSVKKDREEGVKSRREEKDAKRSMRKAGGKSRIWRSRRE